MLVNVISGDSYYMGINSVLAEISMLVFTPLLFFHAVNEKHCLSLLTWMVMTVFAIIAIETIATFYLDQSEPGVLRSLFSESLITDEREELLYPYYRLGLSNYKLPHALPMLIPPLVMGISDKNHSFRIRIWSFVFLFFVLLLIWLSGVMTAFLFAIFFLSLSLYYSYTRKLSWLSGIVFCLIFFPFIFDDQLVLNVIQVSQKLFSGNDYIYRKLLLFEESMNVQYASGDILERQILYSMSLNEFSSNIIFGSNNEMGNHSTILDRLGTLGLIGFIPYILFFYHQLKTARSFILPDKRFFYDMAMAAGILMFLLKDVDNWEMYLMLFTVAPLLMIFLSTNPNAKR